MIFIAELSRFDWQVALCQDGRSRSINLHNRGEVAAGVSGAAVSDNLSSSCRLPRDLLNPALHFRLAPQPVSWINGWNRRTSTWYFYRVGLNISREAADRIRAQIEILMAHKKDIHRLNKHKQLFWMFLFGLDGLAQRFFLGLSSVLISLNRVRRRVGNGGTILPVFPNWNNLTVVQSLYVNICCRIVTNVALQVHVLTGTERKRICQKFVKICPVRNTTTGKLYWKN